LDFFTQEEFDERSLLSQIQKISNFQLEKVEWRTILGEFEGLRFSIFYYEYPLLSSPKKFKTINIADISDIAAMKITAVSSRGTKRDFVDLYLICKEITPLKEILSLYDKKYGALAANVVHIQKSLIYFDDAENDEMPKMLKEVDWEAVKEFFQTEVKKLVK
jgi:hypothetical protein